MKHVCLFRGWPIGKKWDLANADFGLVQWFVNCAAWLTGGPQGHSKQYTDSPQIACTFLPLALMHTNLTVRHVIIKLHGSPREMLGDNSGLLVQISLGTTAVLHIVEAYKSRTKVGEIYFVCHMWVDYLMNAVLVSHENVRLQGIARCLPSLVPCSEPRFNILDHLWQLIV